MDTGVVPCPILFVFRYSLISMCRALFCVCEVFVVAHVIVFMVTVMACMAVYALIELYRAKSYGFILTQSNALQRSNVMFPQSTSD